MIRERLAEAGLSLPEAPAPAANYEPWAEAGGQLFVSGQLPFRDGEVAWCGRVPSVQAEAEAAAAARQCLLNALAVVDDALRGDWERFVRLIRIGVFVACEDGFTGQSRVANGASDLACELLGEAGRHARAAVGVSALPSGASVELELSASIRS